LAAIKLFSINGYHKTTLRELAEEAGLSYGNVYDYIGCKEDIFSLIHEFAAGSAMEALRASIKNVTDPLERLRRIIRTEFELMSKMSDAIMLIYQESHILSKSYLHQLLNKEREHLSLIEQAIEESVKAGRLKRCNIRLVANLIKSLIDSWVIKRWDMRKLVNRTEAETTILEMLFHGMLSDREPENNHELQRHGMRLSGQAVLVANAHTPIGISLCHDLLSCGCRLAVCGDTETFLRESPDVCGKTFAERVHFCPNADHGQMSSRLFMKIEKDMGHIDVYIHDLGLGTLELSQDKSKARMKLAANLTSAEETSDFFTTKKVKTTPKRIVYIAPWSWDQFQDPIRFESVKAGVFALTKALADQLAKQEINVNCVVPGFIKNRRPSKLEKQVGADVQTKIPKGVMGEIFDVIEAVFFLLSDSARYITGQVINVSGGLR
jgi:NAD(P)-dependent dehydrogenase (short-subunit alcohol dehydrogenase family)